MEGNGNGNGLADPESTVDSHIGAFTSQTLPAGSKGVVEGLAEQLTQIDIAPEAGSKAKKKKKKRTKAQQRAPDGFGSDYEEDITPDIVEEELKIYDTRIPFTRRIEKALQRYRAKRRFSPRKVRIFNTYLTFGGIDTGPKEYQGHEGVIDAEDAEDALMIGAVDFVNDDRPDLLGEVDIPYVVQCYLSYHMTRVLGYWTMDYAIEAPLIIENLFKYMKLHNVLPEFTSQIEQVFDLVWQAKKELPLTIKISKLLPGPLGMAIAGHFGYLPDFKQEDRVKQEDLFAAYYDDNPVTMISPKDDESFNRMEYVHIIPHSDKNGIVLVELKSWWKDEDERAGQEYRHIKVPVEVKTAEMILPGMIFDATWRDLSNGTCFMYPIVGVDPTFFRIPDEDEDGSDSEFSV